MVCPLFFASALLVVSFHLMRRVSCVPCVLCVRASCGVGTYTVFFNATVAGKFELHITESGESIGNSPLPYVIEPGRVDVNETIITGVPPSSVPVGNPIQLSITARDRFRNATTPDQPFLVTVATPGGQVAKLSCQATSPNVFMYASPPALPVSE